ncbi:hypothetical protein ACKU27_26970 [Sphingobium yanoikuyae]|jgi:hypothetical protein|uniref:hypothetical protein n=1 Tax=Sphingobium yanoikuyae TaxID=13690 RepID=UPI000F7F55F6|nr:hypothetical protein [Sphingobium yanoikuyae]
MQNIRYACCEKINHRIDLGHVRHDRAPADKVSAIRGNHGEVITLRMGELGSVPSDGSMGSKLTVLALAEFRKRQQLPSSPFFLSVMGDTDVTPRRHKRHPQHDRAIWDIHPA